MKQILRPSSVPYFHPRWLPPKWCALYNISHQIYLQQQFYCRFASFVEGNSHLSDDEILEYETSIQQTDLTDDEEDVTEEEED